jgi:hypothetical protein
MSNDRQPWPMKWVVLVIVVCITAYTILTLRFRKQEPAFRPYEDMQKRANVARLLSAGYQRIAVNAERPADANRAPNGATISAAAGGIPAELRATLVITPLLPSEILSVTAAASTPADQGYAIQFTCTVPDDKQQLGGAELYLRGEQLILVPRFEHIGGDLFTRSRAAAGLITVPPGALKPGRYDVTLVAERTSRAWSLEVK